MVENAESEAVDLLLTRVPFEGSNGTAFVFSVDEFTPGVDADSESVGQILVWCFLWHARHRFLEVQFDTK